MQFYKHGSYNGIAVLQYELKRVTGVTSVSYLGPLSTNIFEPRYKKCAQPVCTIFFSRSAVCCVFLYKRLGSQNNKRSTGMSSRGLLARVGQLPAAGPFLSTYTYTCSTSHILNTASHLSTSTACCYSISHSSIPLSSPLEVEVEVPWGKIAGLQWSLPQTNPGQKQVEAISDRIDKAIEWPGEACPLVGLARADGQPWHLRQAPARLATWHTG